jgi:tetratricopeptide (TPR) repeat protein
VSEPAARCDLQLAPSRAHLQFRERLHKEDGRELQGDVAAAAEALEAAARVAPGRPEQAFATFQLGELAWNAGRVEEAIAAYRRASALEPEYVAPKAGLARAAWAQGRTEEAIEAYRLVVDRLPAPQYLTELADLYTVTGHPERAADQIVTLRRRATSSPRTA